MVPEKSLAYYMALATDFTKLVRYIYSKFYGQPEAVETIRECFAAVDTSGQNSLANVSIDLFTHFIANDSGNARKQMKFFFKDVLLKQLLTPKERSFVFEAIMDKFLKTPSDLISQKSIIESLLFIEIPTNDLVLYLARGLGLHGEPGSQLKENPITMMYAVMYMTEKLFSKLQTNNQTFEVQTLNNVSLKQIIKPSKSRKELAADHVEEVAQVKDEAGVNENKNVELDCDQVFNIFFQICI